MQLKGKRHPIQIQKNPNSRPDWSPKSGSCTPLTGAGVSDWTPAGVLTDTGVTEKTDCFCVSMKSVVREKNCPVLKLCVRCYCSATASLFQNF